MVHTGSDERKLRDQTGGGQIGTLRQETVTRVDRVAVSCLSREYYLRNIEVRLRTLSGNQNGLITHFGMQAGLIVARVNSNGPNSHIRCSASNADGYLATVRN